MRTLVWYSPEYDAIVFQTFNENCWFMSFEWGTEQAVQIAQFGYFDPMTESLFLMLGWL